MPKKAKKAALPEQNDDIFTTLGLVEEPEGEDEGSEGGSEGGKGDKGGDNAALTARIDALQRELDRVTRTNTALMAQTPQYQVSQRQDQGPQEQQVALPDPTMDPEGYKKAVFGQVSAELEAKFRKDQEAREAQAAEARANQERVEGLWSDFSEKYPDLAEHRDMVELAAVSVAQRARARGLDAQKYMFGASEQYLDDVAKEVEKRFGKALKVMGQEEEDDDGSDAGSAGGTMAEALAAARTGGISGGAPVSGGGASSRGGSDDEGGSGDDLIADLHRVQRRLGIR